METQETYTLITGGTEGIGLELAKQFASNEHNLIIVARDQRALEAARAVLESQTVDVITITKDLFKPEAPFELYDEIKNKGLIVDILVNNAGQGVYGLFEETDIHRELAIVQLNIASLIVLTKLFLQEML